MMGGWGWGVEGRGGGGVLICSRVFNKGYTSFTRFYCYDEKDPPQMKQKTQQTIGEIGWVGMEGVGVGMRVGGNVGMMV